MNLLLIDLYQHFLSRVSIKSNLLIETSMTNLFISCNVRAKAYAMLLVWMFWLFSGLANACLVEPAGYATHVMSAAHSLQKDLPHASSIRHSQTEASSVQADDASISKQACLKVCDDNSRSLTKKYQAGQIDAGLSSVVAVLWSLVEPVYLSHTQPGTAQHVVSKVPLRHRYARLAL